MKTLARTLGAIAIALSLPIAVLPAIAADTILPAPHIDGTSNLIKFPGATGHQFDPGLTPAFNGDVTCPAGNPAACLVSKIGGKTPAAVALSGSASDLQTGTLPDSRLTFGFPVRPSKPDTVEAYPAVTTVAGSCNVTLAGFSFQSSDAGKLIKIWGAGAVGGNYVGKISSVTDAQDIVVANIPGSTDPACPTLAMEGISQRVMYGSDQGGIAGNLQSAATLGANLNVGMFVQAGTYLSSTKTTCLPAAIKNGQNAPGAMCNMDMGATIVAMTPMTDVIQNGSYDFSAPIRNGTWGGGTVDCNFEAKYGDDAPLVIVGTLQNRLAKNCLLAGVREGLEPTDPNYVAVGGGMLLSNWDYARDINNIVVTNVTNANPPVVTTQWDNGLTNTSVITLKNMAAAGMTGYDLKFFEVSVVDARHFKLLNTSTTAAGTFHGTALMAKNMPSMHVPHFVTGITNANPAVVSVGDNHNFVNGQQVFLADQLGMTLGGVYTACSVTAQTFQPHAAGDTGCTGAATDTTAAGAWTCCGSVEGYDNPLTIEKGVYLANMPDADGMNLQIQGVRYGVYGNPATSGYDGKWVRLHIYNFGEDGQLFAGTRLGGDEVINSAQVDVPFRYGFVFSGQKNTLISSRINYSGNQQYSNYASFVRLEPGGAVDVIGGGGKGDSNAFVLGTVSCNGCTSFGVAPGFSQIGWQGYNVSLLQPASVDNGDFRVLNYAGNASLTLRGSTNGGLFNECSSQASTVGAFISISAGAAYGGTLDQNCVYTGTSYRMTPGQFHIDGVGTITKLAGGAGTPALSVNTGSAAALSSSANDLNGTITAAAANQVVTLTFANTGYANPRDCEVTWLGGTAGTVGAPTTTNFSLTFGGTALKATYHCMGL